MKTSNTVSPHRTKPCKIRCVCRPQGEGEVGTSFHGLFILKLSDVGGKFCWNLASGNSLSTFLRHHDIKSPMAVLPSAGLRWNRSLPPQCLRPAAHEDGECVWLRWAWGQPSLPSPRRPQDLRTQCFSFKCPFPEIPAAVSELHLPSFLFT